MFVIKLRGLPWSCTTEDIVKFMEGVRICGRDEDGSRLAIYLMNNADGRPSGEAFIKVFGEEDVEAACNKNNALMGQRYIEVFRSNVEQLEKHTNESSSSSQNWREPVVRLRGLPYGCEKRDILAFFDGKQSVRYLFVSCLGWVFFMTMMGLILFVVGRPKI